VEADKSVSEPSSHIINIGQMVEVISQHFTVAEYCCI